MPRAWYILFLNRRTILDIAYFRFSHENWLSHICQNFERRQFKSLSHSVGASEEYELSSATSLWLNIAHADINNTVKFKVLSLEVIPFWARLRTLVQKSYCYTHGVSVSVGVRMQNVRANVKVMKFQSLCIFSCILTLLIKLINPHTKKLTTGAHPMTVAPRVMNVLKMRTTVYNYRWNNVSAT